MSICPTCTTTTTTTATAAAAATATTTTTLTTALHRSCCRSSKQDRSVSLGMWQGWATLMTCSEPNIHWSAGWPRTGGAAQDVHVTPGYGPWKPTFSRSTTDWTQRGDTPRSRTMEAARGNGCATVRGLPVMMMTTSSSKYSDNAWLHFLTWPFAEPKFGLSTEFSQKVKWFRCEVISLRRNFSLSPKLLLSESCFSTYSEQSLVELWSM